MKRDPIIFREIYKDGRGDSIPGFESFKDEIGYHDERHLLLTPFNWDKGYGVKFRIEDKVFPEEVLNSDGSYSLKAPIFVKVEEVTYYDKNNENARILMRVLITEDVRGEYAAEVAASLKNSLFLYSKEMRRALPKIVAYAEKMAKEYNWEVTAGNT